MGNSLRDQLIKAGLAEQEPAGRRAPKAKPQAQKTRRPSRAKSAGRKPPAAAVDPALERERRELRAMEQARIREEKQAQEAAREKQQRRERVRDFLLEHQHNDSSGDIPYNFQAGSRIRRLYVTAAQRDALLAGRLRIAVLGKRDFLIEPPQAEQAQSMDAELYIHDASQVDEGGPAEDDPYKDYAVPDDLMW